MSSLKAEKKAVKESYIEVSVLQNMKLLFPNLSDIKFQRLYLNQHNNKWKMDELVYELAEIMIDESRRSIGENFLLV